MPVSPGCHVWFYAGPLLALFPFKGRMKPRYPRRADVQPRFYLFSRITRPKIFGSLKQSRLRGLAILAILNRLRFGDLAWCPPGHALDGNFVLGFGHQGVVALATLGTDLS